MVGSLKSGGLIEIQDCKLLKRARAGITGRGEMQGLKCTSQLHRSGTNQCIEGERGGGEMLASVQWHEA